MLIPHDAKIFKFSLTILKKPRIVQNLFKSAYNVQLLLEKEFKIRFWTLNFSQNVLKLN